MKNSIKKCAVLKALAAGLALPFFCQGARAGLFGMTTLESEWAAERQTADGDAAEWKKAQLYETDGVALAARNDGENVYIYISPKDKEVRSQFAGEYGQSFFVWFDPAGGKGTALGVKVARRKAGPQGGDRPPAISTGMPAGLPGMQPPDISSAAAPQAMTPPAGEPQQAGAREPEYTAGFVTDDADSPATDLKPEGIEVAVGTLRSRMTIELKVPLAKLEDMKKGLFSMGVKTTDVDAKTLASLKPSGGKPAQGGAPSAGFDPGMNGGPGLGGERPSGPPPGGMGAGGPPSGGMGGGMGGGPGMGQQNTSSSSDSSVTVDPVSIWVKVKLAAK